MLTQARASEVKTELARHFLILFSVVAAMWFVEVADLLLWRGTLDLYGVFPRTVVGLRHIFVAPFLHVGFGHLLANTLPFLVLGWFVMLRRTSDFFLVGAVAALISGLGIWLFGASNSVHIGMSGVIFGFLGFLLVRGVLERSTGSMLLAGIALFFYGGMLWGVLPGQPGVSWLGHLFGFFGGGLAAYLLTNKRPPQPHSR